MPSEIKRALLGRLAIHAGLVTQQQVVECLNEQQAQFRAKKQVPRLGEILYRKGYLTKEQVRALLLYRKSVTIPRPPPEEKISAIGDYEILMELGADATGTFYKARNQKTEDIVSLKVMSQEIMASAGFRERFVAESKRGASLNHPNVRRLITVGCKDSRYFYTSEYVEGSSLKQILDEKKKLGVEEAGRITRELAGALHHGHEKGIIHGDVRPSNILITPDGDVKLMEMGVLKDTLRNLMRLMGTADTVGFYIAPEQAVGDRVVGPRADVYSLGAVYYHMLVGKPPFEGESPLQSLIRLCEEKFTPPHEADESIPQAVSDVVVKMVHAEPSERQGSMTEVEKDLDTAGAAGAAPMAAVAVPDIEDDDSPGESAEEYVSDSGAPMAAAAAVPDIEDDDPGEFGEEYVSDSAEETGMSVESSEEAPVETAGSIPALRGRRRSHSRSLAQPAASRWGIAIVIGSVLVVGAVVMGAFLLSSKRKKESSVSSPSPAEASEQVASEEKETDETAVAAEDEDGEGKPEKPEEAAEENDREEEPEGKDPEAVRVAEPKSKAEPKPVTEEEAAFGRGASLFAPVGWKPPKETDEEE